jgi:hypothetical protein
MKYLAGFNFPVPKIYAWVLDSNLASAEYMIMEKVSRRLHSLLLSQFNCRKVPGRSVESMRGTLSLLDKKNIVKQVARHLLAAFQLRFDQAGSLYLSYSSNPYCAIMFFEVEYDGSSVYSDPHVAEGIQKFRGPFSNATTWLSHSLRAHIFALKATRDHIFDADTALSNMKAAVRLCSIYPGEHPIIPHIKSPRRLFLSGLMTLT